MLQICVRETTITFRQRWESIDSFMREGERERERERAFYFCNLHATHHRVIKNITREIHNRARNCPFVKKYFTLLWRTERMIRQDAIRLSSISPSSSLSFSLSLAFTSHLRNSVLSSSLPNVLLPLWEDWTSGIAILLLSPSRFHLSIAFPLHCARLLRFVHLDRNILRSIEGDWDERVDGNQRGMFPCFAVYVHLKLHIFTREIKYDICDSWAKSKLIA